MRPNLRNDGEVEEKMGAMRMTIKQFFLPAGRSTQRVGVSSDVVLPSFTAVLPISERDMEYAIVATRVNGLPFIRCQMVDDEMKRKLQEG